MANFRRDGRRHLKPRADGRFRVMYHGELIYGYTEDEVYAEVDRRKAEEAEGLRVREDPTVAEYGNRWLPIHKAGVTDKVYNDYAGQLTHLYKVIGEKKIREVRPSDIKEAYNQYLGRSQSTIRRARLIWVSMFDSAVADGLIRTNPAKDKTAQPHKGTSGSHRAVTQEERQLILETEHPLRPLVMLMLYAGLRRGEALAVNVDEDVDFEAGVIRVDKAIRFDGNAPVLADPKTEAGRREVPLIPVLAEILKGMHGLVFGTLEETEDGKKVWKYATEQKFSRAWESYINTLERAENGGLWRRWYGKTREHKAILAAGGQLPPYKAVTIRPHDLRHSYCTMLRDAGVDLKVAMEWLGHADEKMILKIYDHTEGRIKASVERLTAFIADPNADPNNLTQMDTKERKSS